MISAGGEEEKSNWHHELQKGGILMSTTVHVSKHITDECCKGSNGDE